MSYLRTVLVPGFMNGYIEKASTGYCTFSVLRAALECSSILLVAGMFDLGMSRWTTELR
jgi:hypothetical protein